MSGSKGYRRRNLKDKEKEDLGKRRKIVFKIKLILLESS